MWYQFRIFLFTLQAKWFFRTIRLRKSLLLSFWQFKKVLLGILKSFFWMAKKLSFIALFWTFGFSGTLVFDQFDQIKYDGEGWKSGLPQLETLGDFDPVIAKADYYLNLDGSLPPHSQGLPLWTQGYEGQALNFRSPQNAIAIPHSPAAFFNQVPDLGNFYIEFFFRIHEAVGGQILIEKKGLVYDAVNEEIVNQGFTVGIENGRLKVDFENIFHFKNKHFSFSLERGKVLTPGRWYQAVVVYLHNEAELIKYLDGQVEERLFTTISGGEEGTRLYPSFIKGTKTDLVLGSRFSGDLDEIRMSRGERQKLVVKRFPDSMATFMSTVLPMARYSKINKISLAQELQGQSSVTLKLRVAPKYFLPQDDVVAWQQVPLNTGFESGEGQFFQFSLEVKNIGLFKPNVLKAIQFEFDTQPILSPPELISVTEQDRSLILKWRVTSENDLAGYNAYAIKGSGDLRKNNPELLKWNFPFKATWRKDSYEASVVEMKIDNLENGSSYQVALTAYDSKGPSHESKFSAIFIKTPNAFALSQLTE